VNSAHLLLDDPAFTVSSNGVVPCEPRGGSMIVQTTFRCGSERRKDGVDCLLVGVRLAGVWTYGVIHGLRS
jgi:hypothetical protein